MLYPLSYGAGGAKDTLLAAASPAGRLDNGADGLGIRPGVGTPAVDLTQKCFEHRERPQHGAMVAFTGLMLIEQSRDRGHIEERGSRRAAYRCQARSERANRDAPMSDYIDQSLGRLRR